RPCAPAAVPPRARGAARVPPLGVRRRRRSRHRPLSPRGVARAHERRLPAPDAAWRTPVPRDLARCAACDPARGPRGGPPVRDAYRLMDRGAHLPSSFQGRAPVFFLLLLRCLDGLSVTGGRSKSTRSRGSTSRARATWQSVLRVAFTSPASIFCQ